MMAELLEVANHTTAKLYSEILTPGLKAGNFHSSASSTERDVNFSATPHCQNRGELKSVYPTYLTQNGVDLAV